MLLRNAPQDAGTEPPRAEVGPAPRWPSRLLTASLVLSAVVFVALTVGTSLLGRTSFYGGGELVNHQPWLAYGQSPIEVTNPYIGDTIDFFIPGRSEIVDRVRDGDWPGWSDRQGAGAELASVPSYGLLAPTGLAWWVLPHDLAPAWEKLTVLVLAAAGTALFLRRLSVGRHAAWLGGMVYAGSGFMMAWTNWPQAGIGAMLPWLFWSVERALQLGTWRAHAPVALAVAALLLGGFPAVTGLGLYAAAGYVLVRLLTRAAAGGARPGAGRWRAVAGDIGRLAAALATGFLLAGVQLATFAYVFLDLDTGHREGSFGRLLPLRMALTSLFPNAWGTSGTFFTETNPIEANAYLGVAAAVLVVAALVLRPGPFVPRGARLYFAAVAALLVLLVYVQGPLLRWVGVLPVFAGNPIGRSMAVALLALAVLAGIGTDAVLRGSAGSRAARLRLAAGAGATVLATAALGWWVLAATAGVPEAGGASGIVALALAGAVVTAVAVAGAGATGSHWRPAVLAVVPVVVAVQAVTAATPLWAQVPREAFYPTTPVHEFLLAAQGSDRIAVTGATMVSGPTAYYGLRTAPGHVFAKPEFNDLRRAACGPCLLSATNWVLPRETDLDIWLSPLLDRMAARYLTADPDGVIPGRPVEVVRGDRPVVVPEAGAGTLTAEVPPGPLRGVVLGFAAGPPLVADGHLLVEVADRSGTVLAATRHHLRFPRPPSALNVPLVGESLDPGGGPLDVRVSWLGPGPAPHLATDAGGRPALGVVRPEDDGLRLVRSEGAAVWERLTALPRIRWASAAEVVGDGAARVAALAGGAVPAGTVVLDRPGPPADGAPADVEVLEDSGDTVRVRVDADGAGYLVLAQSVQADWTATLDGEEVPVVDADHAFGAVAVPAGRHVLAFEHDPRGGDAGAVASAIGLVALAAMVWGGRRPAQPRGPAIPVIASDRAARHGRRGDRSSASQRLPSSTE